MTAECQFHLLLTDQVCGNGSGITYVLFASVFHVLRLLPIAFFARWTCVLKFTEVYDEARAKNIGLKFGLLMVSSWLLEVHGLLLLFYFIEIHYRSFRDCVHH